MELFKLEHKKLWCKTSVKISVILCFTYLVIFGSILSFQWFSLGSQSGVATGFGNHFDGYATIKESKEYGRTFAGDLTDETVQRMVRNYQQINEAGEKGKTSKTDWQTVNGWLGALWPEMENSAIYKTKINYYEPEKLTGFYERRQKAIEQFLEINNQTGKEKEYLLNMNEKVDVPFHYEWARGWSIVLGTIAAEMGTVIALFLAIALSSSFAGEWRDNTGTLMLTTKNGWESVARAKIFSGLAFAAELFSLLAAGNIIAQLFFLGTAGWDMPIQIMKPTAVAPMNMLQAEIYEYGFNLLCTIGFAGIVMLISAAVKSNVLSLVLSMAVLFVPAVVQQYFPYEVQKVMDLIPFVGSGTDIFRTNTYQIFGRIIWSPYLLITVPVLLGILCMPLAVKRWSRRLKV